MAGERGYYDAFTIDGVDVLPYLNNYIITEVKNTGNKYSKMTARFASEILNAVFLVTGLDVVVSRGVSVATEDYKMRGDLMKFQEDDGEILMEIDGRLNAYKKKNITYSFDKDIDVEAGNPSKIWNNLALRGGIASSYVDSGTDIILDKFICNDDNLFERMGVISQFLGWQMYDDYNNNYLRLEPVGYTSYPTPLILGTNIIELPVWNEELEPMRNNIKVKGAYEEDTMTQSFSGTGAQTDFTLSHEPEITFVKVNTTEKVRGVAGSTTTYDYTVDKQQKIIKFVVAPAGGTTVYVQYTHTIPKPVQGKDFASIAYYGKEREESYDFKDIQTVNDAKLRLKMMLKYLAWAFTYTTLRVINTPNMTPGMLVSVQDSQKPKYSGTYVVNKIVYNYPSPIDEVQIGSTDFSADELFSNINNRLMLLEKVFSLNAGELTQLLQFNSSKELETRVFALDKGTIKTDTLYWTSPIQGKWGAFKWSDGTPSAKTRFILMPGKNQFREFVYDSEFYDSVNSVGVTWDTTGNDLTIDATTGVYLSKAISINTLYTAFNVDLGTYTATGLVVEISCDAKSTWEPVVLGVTTFFTGMTSDIYLRISNPTAGAITISTDKNLGGEYINPAIEVQLS